MTAKISPNILFWVEINLFGLEIFFHHLKELKHGG